MKIQWEPKNNGTGYYAFIEAFGLNVLSFVIDVSKFDNSKFFVTLNGQHLGTAASIDEAKVLCQKYFDIIEQFFVEGNPLKGYHKDVVSKPIKKQNGGVKCLKVLKRKKKPSTK